MLRRGAFSRSLLLKTSRCTEDLMSGVENSMNTKNKDPYLGSEWLLFSGRGCKWLGRWL